MLAGKAGLGQKAVRNAPQIFTAGRLLAVLPLALLCVYWGLGETGLVAFSLGAPMFALAAAAMRVNSPLPVEFEPPAGQMTRAQLVGWLNCVMSSSATLQPAVIVMVIDELDGIETRFGRDGREIIIGETMLRLRETLRQDDTIALLENQEIAFALRDVRPPETENLLRLARRLQSICDEPFPVGPSRVYCTISIGFGAALQLTDPTPEKLLQAAESAGKFAVSAGPSSVRVFSEGLNSAKDEERRKTRALSSALETGEIFAWYQPQVTSDGGSIVGFEALARWDRPEHGLVMPGAFLPSIQKAGLSQRLAEVILKQALTALNAWDAAGFSVPAISVNFSGEDLRNPRLSDYVLWELDRFDLAPDRLVIEILESIIADQHEEAITRTLIALSRAGCRIDLDDFGTGSTSMLNVQRFNVSRLKIDRCLVSHLDRDPNQQRMVAALLSFAEKLGIEALAEGVETETERETLRKLGCKLVQGHVAARPMPLGETLLWLEARADIASEIKEKDDAATA